MLQGLFKRPSSPSQTDPFEEKVDKRWSATRVLADLLSRGPNLGTLTGAWTSNRAELVRHIRHWVFVAAKARCKMIAKQVANVSVKQKAFSETRRKWIIDGPYSKMLARKRKGLPIMARDEVLEPAPFNHPVTELMTGNRPDKPNPIDTHYQLCYEQELMSCATGNEYIWMPKNRFGKPCQMWVLPSHWVWPVVGTENLIDEYEIRPVEGGYKRLVFPADEVLHLPSKSPISKIDGLSPLDAGSRWVDSSESIDQSRWHTMKQGTFPSVAIKLGAEFFDPSDEDILRVEQKWLSRYQGERRAGKPVIMPPGMDIVPLMMSAREMDYTASAEQLRDCILALYDVPKFAVGISQDVQRNTAEASMVMFSEFGLNPTLEMRGQAYTKYFARYWDDMVIWYDDTTPADSAQLNADLLIDAPNGAVTVNQILELRGRPEVDGGDVPPAVYMMRLQMELQNELGQGEEGVDGRTVDDETEATPTGLARLQPNTSVSDVGHREEEDLHGRDMNDRLGIKAFKPNGKHKKVKK